MRQIVLDTETTGLFAAQGDRIIEIGCVEMINRRRSGNNRHYYVNPERDSHEEALKVHGISSAFLQDKPKFFEIADDLLAYLEGAEIIIHNAPFDVGFLDKELALTGRPVFKTHVAAVVDSLVMAKELFPGKRNSLDALCDRLGVDNSGRTLHGALLDAELLADVYICLTRGQNALLMDPSTERAHTLSPESRDFQNLSLPLQWASSEELAEHDRCLDELDRACRSRAIWRRALPSHPLA